MKCERDIPVYAILKNLCIEKDASRMPQVRMCFENDLSVQKTVLVQDRAPVLVLGI